MIRTGRDASILRLADQQDMSVDRLAEMFGLSRRTIFRVLRAGGRSSRLPDASHLAPNTSPRTIR
jgi:DeoR/GlpR family transcriptional regulator of sugar metabolism